MDHTEKFLPAASSTCCAQSRIFALYRDRDAGTGVAPRARREEIPIVAIVNRSSEQRSDVSGYAATQTAELLAELSPNSDLAWLVERVSRTDLPWVVIPGAAITAWEARDPAGWEKVLEWLAVRGVTIVRI
jgi:hypothetical protein